MDSASCKNGDLTACCRMTSRGIVGQGRGGKVGDFIGYFAFIP